MSIPIKCVWYLYSLLIILHICLLPVASLELPITRTVFDFPRRFELSGVDCSSKWPIQDGRGFQFLIYVIKNVIMTSLLFWKVLNVLANFLILWDTLIYHDFFALWLLWKESGYCQSIQQYGVKLRHYVNQIMPRCWKRWKRYFVWSWWPYHKHKNRFFKNVGVHAY